MRRLQALTSLFALASLGAAAGELLVLRRDWTASTCSGDAGCRTDYPDSFSIDALYLATSVADPEPLASCGGKGRLRGSELAAAGLAAGELSCAWQNYDPNLKMLLEAWSDSWTVFGMCTPAQSGPAYLALGLELDKQYPLPQDLPASVDRDLLAEAVQAGFGARPYIACDSKGQLLNIQLCFDASIATAARGGAAPALRDCPWPAPAECAGQLSVPRTGRGTGKCSAYYRPSPVILGSPPPPAVSWPPPTVAPALPPPLGPAASPPKGKLQASPPPEQPSQAPARPPARAPQPRPQQQPDVPPVDVPAAGAGPGTAGSSGSITGTDATGDSSGSGTASSSGDGSAASGEPAEASTSSGAASSGGGGSGGGVNMAVALAGGIAGGIVVGAAVFGGGYVLYRRGERAGRSSAALLSSGSDSGSGSEQDGGGEGGEGGRWGQADDGSGLSAAESGCAAGEGGVGSNKPKEDAAAGAPWGADLPEHEAAAPQHVPQFVGRLHLPTVYE